MRHRLIPTQGQGRSRFVHGAEDARQAAQDSFDITGIPVLIVRHPAGEGVSRVAIIGKIPKRKKKAA